LLIRKPMALMLTLSLDKPISPALEMLVIPPNYPFLMDFITKTRLVFLSLLMEEITESFSLTTL